MRALLQLPHVNEQNLNEARELIEYLVGMLNEYDVKAPGSNQLVFQDTSVAVEFQTKLARLNQLTGKVNDPLNLAADLQDNKLDDVARFVLQPPPPVLSDITSQEVAQIVAEIMKPEIKKYQAMYYLELLKKNLLLPEVRDYIENLEDKQLANDMLAQAITKKMQ